MFRKRKVLVSVLVAVAVLVPVLLLTVGGVATVMADDPTPPPEAEANGLLSRVAQILDIPEDDLIDAFNQAREEMREEAHVRFLDRALENGRITQEEYDAIMEWWEQRPDVLDCPLPNAFGAPALGSRHMWNNHNAWTARKAWAARNMWGAHGGWGGPGTPRLAD